MDLVAGGGVGPGHVLDFELLQSVNGRVEAILSHGGRFSRRVCVNQLQNLVRRRWVPWWGNPDRSVGQTLQGGIDRSEGSELGRAFLARNVTHLYQALDELLLGFDLAADRIDHGFRLAEQLLRRVAVVAVRSHARHHVPPHLGQSAEPFDYCIIRLLPHSRSLGRGNVSRILAQVPQLLMSVCIELLELCRYFLGRGERKFLLAADYGPSCEPLCLIVPAALSSLVSTWADGARLGPELDLLVELR